LLRLPDIAFDLFFIWFVAHCIHLYSEKKWWFAPPLLNSYLEGTAAGAAGRTAATGRRTALLLGLGYIAVHKEITGLGNLHSACLILLKL
jgi:hypothetical protein